MSGSIRLFVASPLAEGADAPGSAAQAHYLAHVMRRTVGAPVLLFNGRDGEWRGRIAALKGDRVGFTVADRLRAQAPAADVWLAFSLLKRDATDLVVRMATELGAAVLIPVTTERTNTARINPERLAAIATEAAEQCERLTVPEIRAPVALPQLLSAWPAERRLFAAIERSDAPAAGFTMSAASSRTVGLLVGPEGGFAARELDAIRARAFVVAVSLGPLILRAETAAVAGLALMLASGCIASRDQTA